jgi:hypothetical protein
MSLFPKLPWVSRSFHEAEMQRLVKVAAFWKQNHAEAVAELAAMRAKAAKTAIRRVVKIRGLK